MNTPKFYPLEFRCPQCKKTGTVIGVYFSSQGLIDVEGVCIVCNTTLQWERNIFAITSDCIAHEKPDVFQIAGTSTIQ